jgi:hypothetical protein
MATFAPFAAAPRRVPLWLNLLAFQGLWWTTILSVAEGQVWIGPSLVLLAAAAQLAWLPDRGAELRLWLWVVLPGFLIDSALAAGGGFGFPNDRWLMGSLPPWMGGLWLGFALTVRHGLAWLHGRPVVAALFGLIGGPATYLGGAKLGALTIGTPNLLWLSALGSGWAIACGLWFGRPLRTADPLPAAGQAPARP